MTLHPDEPCWTCGARSRLTLHPDGSIASAYHDCPKGPPGPPNPPRFFPQGKFQPRPGADVKTPRAYSFPVEFAEYARQIEAMNLTPADREKVEAWAYMLWMTGEGARSEAGDWRKDAGRDLFERRIASGKSLREAAAEAGITPVELGQIERGVVCGSEYRGHTCDLEPGHEGFHSAIVHGVGPMYWTDADAAVEADRHAEFWAGHTDNRPGERHAR